MEFNINIFINELNRRKAVLDEVCNNLRAMDITVNILNGQRIGVDLALVLIQGATDKLGNVDSEKLIKAFDLHTANAIRRRKDNEEFFKAKAVELNDIVRALFG